MLRKGRFRALSGDRFPKRPGYDWSGTVDALGASVTTLHAGQRAFGMVNGWAGQTCAQFINVRAADVARVRAEQHVYVNGASGGVRTTDAIGRHRARITLPSWFRIAPFAL